GGEGAVCQEGQNPRIRTSCVQYGRPRDAPARPQEELGILFVPDCLINRLLFRRSGRCRGRAEARGRAAGTPRALSRFAILRRLVPPAAIVKISRTIEILSRVAEAAEKAGKHIELMVVVAGTGLCWVPVQTAQKLGGDIAGKR